MPERRVVATRDDFGDDVRRELRLGRERGKRSARHGDRAQMSGLDLGRHIKARRAGDLGRRRSALTGVVHVEGVEARP